MSTSTGELDLAFGGAGKEIGLQIWRVENFRPVPVPKASYGKFFMGDSYIVLKTYTAPKSGDLQHDIHYWLGKDTSQDEAGTAAILTFELDKALGGGPVEYREVQGDESEKFLSYFKPCVITQPGGIVSGFNHTEINAQEHVTRLYQCKGRLVEELLVEKSSLNHGDIFILDTQSKIYQFRGSYSSIQERAKAMEVVQHIKHLYHEDSCDTAIIEDAEVAEDADSCEFWEYFGGFGTISAPTCDEDNSKEESPSAQLYNVQQRKPVTVDTDNLTMDLLETNKCYLLESGLEIDVWMGKATSIAVKKGANKTAEPGGIVSGFNHAEINAQEHVTRLYQCKGHRIQEVLVEKSSLNHGDIFILDTQSKIYQFRGSYSSIQERAKALEVVQHIKHLYHEDSCDTAIIEDSEVAEDADSSEFWEYFGGFGTILAPTCDEDNSKEESPSAQLYNVQQGKLVTVDTDNLIMDLLETNKCYLLESGLEIYVWMGKATSLADKKGANKAVEELLHDPKRKKYRVIRVIEGYEIGLFKSKFTGWAVQIKIHWMGGRGRIRGGLKKDLLRDRREIIIYN